jgi:SAM-dependent methyltransferase
MDWAKPLRGYPGDDPGSSFTSEFFAAEEDGVLRSARLVVPLVVSLLRPRSVVDVGCGRGAWLRTFQENGVPEVHGLDGSYVNSAELLIDPAQFSSADLSQPFSLGRTYDLAVCLEVAEHLPARAAGALVDALAQAAPLVLFSAAIPGQGGVRHVNEQWPSYWRVLFEQRGFRRLDPVRRQIWQDARVLDYYRQNLFVFASEEVIRKEPELAEEARIDRAAELELITTGVLEQLKPPQSLRRLLRQIPRSVWRAATHRLGLE